MNHKLHLATWLEFGGLLLLKLAGLARIAGTAPDAQKAISFE